MSLAPVPSVPFAEGTGGYPAYRIPAVVKTTAGTLLAFAEGRSGGSDTGRIDLVLRRSTDGGTSWKPLQTVASSGANTCGNPTAAVLPGGRVLLVTCYNGGDVDEHQIMRGEASAEDTRRVFVQHSDDDGITFSPRTEITNQVKRPNWRWYATGPGTAVVTHTGRVVVPANHSTAPPDGSSDQGDEAKYYGGHCFFSDDHGATWAVGFVNDTPDGVINENETSVAELPDGRLYFNTRNNLGTAPGTRADGYSADGGETLSVPYRPQATLQTAVVQGSVLEVGGGTLLFAGPWNWTQRAAMGVFVSHDAGATWELRHRVSGLPAGYSSLVRLDAGTVGLLYETGEKNPYQRIEFVRIPLAGLVT